MDLALVLIVLLVLMIVFPFLIAWLVKTVDA